MDDVDSCLFGRFQDYIGGFCVQAFRHLVSPFSL
jgi:hypothetical protein